MWFNSTEDTIKNFMKEKKNGKSFLMKIFYLYPTSPTKRSKILYNLLCIPLQLWWFRFRRLRDDGMFEVNFTQSIFVMKSFFLILFFIDSNFVRKKYIIYCRIKIMMIFVFLPSYILNDIFFHYFVFPSIIFPLS